MKLTESQKNARFAKRALPDFSNAMFKLLQEYNFKKITVAMLCEKCNYPRSTFYKYFDGLDDLLDYCWSSMSTRLNLDDCRWSEDNNLAKTVFLKIFDFGNDVLDSITLIFVKNDINGEVWDSFSRYMYNRVYEVILKNMGEKDGIPQDIRAEHYTRTIIIILNRCFFKEPNLSKEKALQCLDYFVGK